MFSYRNHAPFFSILPQRTLVGSLLRSNPNFKARTKQNKTRQNCRLSSLFLLFYYYIYNQQKSDDATPLEGCEGDFVYVIRRFRFLFVVIRFPSTSKFILNNTITGQTEGGAITPNDVAAGLLKDMICVYAKYSGENFDVTSIETLPSISASEDFPKITQAIHDLKKVGTLDISYWVNTTHSSPIPVGLAHPQEVKRKTRFLVEHLSSPTPTHTRNRQPSPSKIV